MDSFATQSLNIEKKLILTLLVDFVAETNLETSLPDLSLILDFFTIGPFQPGWWLVCGGSLH